MAAVLNEMDVSPREYAGHAWAERNTEGQTYADAHCRHCGLRRLDVKSQVFNARHPDGRLKAEAIMLAVAWYGRCICGHSEIDILTPRERTEVRRKVTPGTVAAHGQRSLVWTAAHRRPDLDAAGLRAGPWLGRPGVMMPGGG